MGNAKLVLISFRVVRAVGGYDVIPNRISLPEKAIILSGALLGIERESISYFITREIPSVSGIQDARKLLLHP